MICTFIASNFATSAENASIADRFAFADKLSAEEQTGVYNFDKAHSSIGFRVRHMGLVDVPGYFRDFTGSINFDGKDVTKSTVEFTAKMESVDTGVAGRDKHLRTADFFEVEKYPEMTFKSTKVEKKGKNVLVTGDLTMKGMTKQISFPVTVAGFVKDQRGTKIGVTAETTINRRDFGVNYGSNMPNGIATLSDDIKVVLNVEGNLQKAAQ
jgi:polyisoprenoid-binding protein YceI